MNRTAFLVDGFNLYHSLREAQKSLPGRGTKWLDIRALCASYLHIVGSGAEVGEVHYFSALANHLEAVKPGVTNRHRAFISCLEDTGVFVELSRFRKKTLSCEYCGRRLVRWEEKETDVAIAVRLLELFVRDRADSIILMSGDTDLAPAVRLAKRLFPDKLVGFAFPFGRKNRELEKLSDVSFQISKGQYLRFQLPDPYVLQGGRRVKKPAAW